MRLTVWLCIASLASSMLAGRALACTVSAGSLNFGVIDPLANQGVSATATVTVSCPILTLYTLTVSAGNGSYTQRYMSDGSHQLFYNVYSDSTDTLVLGDGSGISLALSGTALSNNYTFYGYMPAQPTAVPGTYSDTLVITVSY